MLDVPTPNLITAHSEPLYKVEEIILNQVAPIEAWFRKQWKETPAPITSSVDLRQSGFKLAPVDTNLFPAGYNNLNADCISLCIQAVQAWLADNFPNCVKILILPEMHTRNTFYLQSLNILQQIFSKAGFHVKIGSLDENITGPTKLNTSTHEEILIEPIVRKKNRIGLSDFDPCLIILNNDLSTGVPDIIKNIEQAICPSSQLGWTSRLKSKHFELYNNVINEFSELIQIDPWLINPEFTAVSGIDFMAQSGLEKLARETDLLLVKIKQKYTKYGINEPAFVAVKADNGTYGMSVMMVKSGDELLHINRKQRTKMSTSKGSQKVTKILIQEGVYTFETMPDGAVAEPVVYMLGQFVVGGFYRVHQGKGKADNLNAVGMHFAPLAFREACNIPCKDLPVVDGVNRFYVYGVVARLAALAAAREMKELGVHL